MSTQDQQREQPYQTAQRLMLIADAAEGPKGRGVSPAFVGAVEEALAQARSDAIGELRGQWTVWLDDHADDKHTIQEIVDWLDREQQYLKARGPGEGI